MVLCNWGWDPHRQFICIALPPPSGLRVGLNGPDYCVVRCDHVTFWPMRCEEWQVSLQDRSYRSQGKLPQVPLPPAVVSVEPGIAETPPFCIHKCLRLKDTLATDNGQEMGSRSKLVIVSHWDFDGYFYFHSITFSTQTDTTGKEPKQERWKSVVVTWERKNLSENGPNPQKGSVIKLLTPRHLIVP